MKKFLSEILLIVCLTVLGDVSIYVAFKIGEYNALIGIASAVVFIRISFWIIELLTNYLNKKLGLDEDLLQ